MRVFLISANRTEIHMRTMPLGLACVAEAARRQGHTVKALDLVGIEDTSVLIASVIEEFDPEVIGISIRNIDDQTSRDTKLLFAEDNQIITLVRKLSQAPIVLGGAGYSIYPEAILEASEADAGIEGEGEVAFCMVLDRLKEGEPLEGLPGVHVKGKGLVAPRVTIKEPDNFPLPDPGFLLADTDSPGEIWMPVQTRRGCSMGCSYCSTGAIEGTVTRRRSPGRVVEWMGELVRRGVKQFYFVDNTFNLPPSYAAALCREIVRASLEVKWRCILYPYGFDEPLAELMAQAGCFEASVGFESANERVLKGMNKRFRLDDVVRTCSILKKYGIRQMGFVMLGGPGETSESIRESLSFAESLDLESMRISVGIRIYPRTALAEQARKEGIITPDDNLLIPKFYIVPGLEDEIREAVEKVASGKKNWIV